MIALLAAAYAADPVVDGVEAELARAAQGLKLPDAAGPYDISAVVWDIHRVEIEATLGGVVTAEANPERTLSTVVRSGSTALDNTNFDTFPTGAADRNLVLGDDALAVRKDAWLLFDDAYKASVEALAAKTAAEQRRAEPDEVADFAPGAPEKADAAPAAAFPLDPLVERARVASAVFLNHPAVEWSRVWVDGEAGRRVSLGTDGTRVSEPVAELVLRVAARVRAEDGSTQVDGVTWIVRSADALPPADALAAEVEALCVRLEAWRALPVLADEYVGPVLFEDEAALELVRQVLAPRLVGTPPEQEAPTGSRVVSFGSDRVPGPIQPRRRLLPAGWSADDDPLRDASRASAYHYDHEGRPARAVELVRDGIVVGHVMSRVPNRWFTETNGHGRSQPGELVRALPSDLRIEPDAVASARAMRKAALKLAASYGSDHYVVVRRLVDPALRPFAGGPIVRLGGDDDGPQPLEVVQVFADGREVPVRSATLAGLDVRSFREVAKAGGSSTATLVWGQSSFFSGPNVGFPVTFTVPDLLLAEVVVSPNPDDAEKPPKLPSPLAAAGGAR